MTRPLVIGCAALPSGRTIELVGYQLGRGERSSSLCIDEHDPVTGITWGCGSNRVFGGGHVDATSTTRLAEPPAILSGALSAQVARVVVRFELRGRLRRQPGAVVRVRDRAILRAIAVKRAFGRYLTEVPAGARAVSAEARGAGGRGLGLAFFPGFGRPVGEGRRCYSRPRVVSARLLDPPRAGRSSRLRVVAIYHAGEIDSIEATVAGRGRFRAELGSDRAGGRGGRRVVTMLVRLPRRGTVGVDVTADGRPISAKCGARALPRRSAPKTLAVRVR